MKLSIIIPVYNEEKTIEQVLKSVIEIKLPKSIHKELIVVNDGSVDNTDRILLRNIKKIKYFKHKQNLGKGAAIRTGLNESSGDLILVQDADLEYNPTYYSKLLEPILQRNESVVYGTRLINYPLRLWGKDKTILPVHLLANKFLTLLTNIIYQSNLTDMETGYKMFKRKVLDSIELTSNNFDFEAELTAKLLKQKIKIVEVPISVRPRSYKEGKKIGWRDGFSAIWTLIKYRFIN